MFFSQIHCPPWVPFTTDNATISYWIYQTVILIYYIPCLYSVLAHNTHNTVDIEIRTAQERNIFCGVWGNFCYTTLPDDGLWMAIQLTKRVHHSCDRLPLLLNLLCIYHNRMFHIKTFMSTFSCFESFYQFRVTVALSVLSIYHKIKRNKVCCYYNQMAEIWAFTLVTGQIYNFWRSYSRQPGIAQTASGSEGIISVNMW